MTYEFAGTEDSENNGQIITLVFKDAAQNEIKVEPLAFYMGQYDTGKIGYRAQTDGAAALVQKGPYPSDIPALSNG